MHRAIGQVKDAVVVSHHHDGVTSLLLEPLLQAGEQHLQRHLDAGQLAPCDVRRAALTLQGPLVLGLLHQDNLSGDGCRPLDLDAFIDAHVDAFLRAFPPTAKGRSPST